MNTKYRTKKSNMLKKLIIGIGLIQKILSHGISNKKNWELSFDHLNGKSKNLNMRRKVLKGQLELEKMMNKANIHSQILVKIEASCLQISFGNSNVGKMTKIQNEKFGLKVVEIDQDIDIYEDFGTLVDYGWLKEIFEVDEEDEFREIFFSNFCTKSKNAEDFLKKIISLKFYYEKNKIKQIIGNFNYGDKNEIEILKVLKLDFKGKKDIIILVKNKGKQDMKERILQGCGENCAVCLGGSCTLCMGGFTLKLGILELVDGDSVSRCVKECSIDSHPTSPSDCSPCSISIPGCSTCKTTKLKQDSNGIIPTAECTSCQSGFLEPTNAEKSQYNIDFQCYKVCAIGKKLNPDSNGQSCEPCGDNIKECNIFTGEPTTCESTHFLTKDSQGKNKCQLKCESPKPPILISETECGNCKEGCSTCLNITRICTLCQNSKFYDVSQEDNTLCSLLELKLTKNSYFEEEKKVTLEFDREITGYDMKNSAGIELNNKPFNEFFEIIKIEKQEEKKLVIEIKWIKELKEASTLKITNLIYKEGTLLPESAFNSTDSSTNKVYIFLQKIIEISIPSSNNQNNTKSSLNPTLKAAAKSSKIALNTAFSISFLIQLPLALTLIKIMQIFEYLTLIDVKLPQKALEFIDIFDENILEITPNIFQSEDGECEMNRKFEDNQMDCKMGNNIGAQITQIIALFIFKLILQGVKKLSNTSKGKSKILDQSGVSVEMSNLFESNEEKSQNKKKNIFFRLFNFLDNYFNIAFFFYYFKAIQFDVVLASFLNIKLYFQDQNIGIFGLITSYIFVAFYFFFICTNFIIIIFKELDERREIGQKIRLKKDYKNWVFLSEELKEKMKIVFSLSNEYTLIGDSLIALFLVVGAGNSYFQAIPIMIVKLSIFIILLKFPFKSTLNSIQCLASEILFFFAVFAFLLADRKLNKEVVDEKNEKNYNWVIIVILSLIVLLTLVISFIRIGIDLYNRYKKYKEWKKKKGKVKEGGEKENVEKEQEEYKDEKIEEKIEDEELGLEGLPKQTPTKDMIIRSNRHRFPKPEPPEDLRLNVEEDRREEKPKKKKRKKREKKNKNKDDIKKEIEKSENLFSRNPEIPIDNNPINFYFSHDVDDNKKKKESKERKVSFKKNEEISLEELMMDQVRKNIQKNKNRRKKRNKSRKRQMKDKRLAFKFN